MAAYCKAAYTSSRSCLTVFMACARVPPSNIAPSFARVSLSSNTDWLFVFRLGFEASPVSNSTSDAQWYFDFDMFCHWCMHKRVAMSTNKHSHSHSHSLSSFGRGMKGPGRGHVKRHHSSAVRITVIIYTTMTKLTEDCEKGDTSSWPKLSSKIRSKLSQNESETQGQKPLNRLPRQCPLCRRPQSTIDANRRRHPSTPPIDATIRRYQSP